MTRDAQAGRQVWDQAVRAAEGTLPRRPVHFVSDIHGEAEAFRHLTLTRSGELGALLAQAYDASPDDPKVVRLRTLVCYPEAVAQAACEAGQADAHWWCSRLRELAQLVHACKLLRPASARVLARARSASERERDACLDAFVSFSGNLAASRALVDVLCTTGAAQEALCALAARVRALAGGPVHMLGDVWDRGARGDEVMDVLMALPECDVQWGNHDVCWMGAAAGDPACIATVLRNNLKYGNVAQFEEGYGISLTPLRAFAAATYADEGEGAAPSPVMKAISVLLFKSEGQAIRRHPEWHMEGRLLLDKIDLAAGTVQVGEEAYPLRTRDFPTLAGVRGSAEPSGDPYAFTADEARVMDELVGEFCASARLQAQVQWLYDHGSAYLVTDGHLLVHGCVPMEPDGSLAWVTCDDGRARAGRELLDWTDELCRRAWELRDQRDLDWMGFFWTGWQSTFMGRVVKTFERTYVEEQSTWKEPEDPYFALTNEDAAACGRVLAAFGLDPETGVIVNGHTPVKLPKGQRPVRGGGHRYVIDGGFCRAYRKSTGIAGYTLIDDARGVRLVTHGEYPGKEAVLAGEDMAHETEVLVRRACPLREGDVR